jgi:tRNA-dihydrouridine synthase A
VSKLASPVNSQSTSPLNRRFTVAPMMEWSDKHCRMLWRLISRHAVLYSEMVTTGAVLHGYRERFLDFDPAEHPVALQLGGSNPSELAECTKLAQDWGYDEVNLNCGCPSDRVQNNMIGAILMAHPQLVADCIKAMQDAADIPVTVKNRIGIDDMEDYPGLVEFIGTVAETGCKTFIVHARKAWLQGLSPKENREKPPLKYEMVHKLKQDFPELEILINGGITELDACESHLNHVDGVMVGREAYHNPYLLADVDRRIYGDEHEIPSRIQVAEQYMVYIEQELTKGARLNHMTRHMLGLFHGMPGARLFRRHISENITKPGATLQVVEKALEAITFRDRKRSGLITPEIENGQS